MAWPVYTTTFVRSNTVGVWANYTVPTGYRAVVKSITGWGSSDPAGAGVTVQVAGYTCFSSNLVSNQSLTTNLTVVAYAGEVIRVLVSTHAGAATVSGFIFQEAGALMQGRPDNWYELALEAEQLPAPELEMHETPA